MKKIVFLLTSAFLLATSCQTSEFDDAVVTDSISFRSQIDTRVEGNLFVDGDKIGVTAFSDSALSNVYAEGVEYSYSDKCFTSDTPITYVVNGGKEYVFYAVYPYQEILSGEFTFSVACDQSIDDSYTMSDLMVAKTVATSSKEPTLTFSRCLSQIVVNVTNQDGEPLDDAVVCVNGYTDVNINFVEDTYSAVGEIQNITAADNGDGSFKVVFPSQTIYSTDDFVTVEYNGECETHRPDDDYVLVSGNSYIYNVVIDTAKDVYQYADKEVTMRVEESAGAPKPVHLIIVGDGYVADDYIEGAKFDQDVETAITAFFGLEPFATYKDYFRVSTVAAYSEESGATVESYMPYDSQPAQTRNTVFSSILEGGYSTGVDCDYDTVFDYAKLVPGVTETELQETTVIVLINLDVYAGTCMMEAYGRSVSMCPAGESTLPTIVQHEAGGHGFGRLLDEYRYYDESLPSSSKQFIVSWRGVDPYFGYNISTTDITSVVHWNQYFDLEGYEDVGLYEGGYLYYYDVWRPESISCMEDNRSYYNAPSREAIVQRIFTSAGLTFDFDDFVSKDVIKSDPYAAQTRAVTDFRPLGAPIFVE